MGVAEASRKCLEAIINYMPDPVFVIDKEGKIIAWNKAISRMLGKSSEEVVGKDSIEISKLFYNKERPVLANLVLSPDKSSEALYENFKRCQDGAIQGYSWTEYKKIYAWAVASPFYDKDGNVIGVIETFRDVTEWKETQDALVSSQLKYKSLFSAARSILDNVNLMIWAKDIDNKYTFVNKAFRDFMGIRSRDMLGKKLNDFAQTGNDYNSEETDNRAKKETVTVVVPIVLSDKKHWLSICKTPLKDENGVLVGTVGTARDVTESIERKKFDQEQVEKLREEIERGVMEWRSETEAVTVEVKKTIEEIRKSMHGVVDVISIEGEKIL